MTEPYFRIKDLKVNFNSYDGRKTVLEIHDLKISRGETYGIIGESGSGKTILALSILKLIDIPPGEIEKGTCRDSSMACKRMSAMVKRWETYCSSIYY